MSALFRKTSSTNASACLTEVHSNSLSDWDLPKRAYYLAVAILYSLYVLMRTSWYSSTPLGPLSDHRRKAILGICAVMLIMKIISENHNRNEWVRIGFTLAVASLIWAVNADEKLAISVVVVAASKDVDLRRLCLVLLIETIAIACLTIALSLAGIIAETSVDGRLTILGFPRKSLGFGNPNGLGLVCLEICMFISVVFQNRNPLLFLFPSVGLLFLAWAIACSRASSVAIVLTILLAMAWRLLHRYPSRVYGIVGALLFVGLVSLSIMLTATFDPSNELMVRIDTLLSGRLTFSNTFYELYPPRLLGHDVNTLPVIDLPRGIGERRFFVDMAYPRLLLRNGILVFTFWIGSVLLFFIRAAKEREINLCMIFLAVYLIYGVMEQVMLSIEPNIYLVALSTIIYSKPVSDFSGRAGRAKP